jgi:hypothetical protein
MAPPLERAAMVARTVRQEVDAFLDREEARYGENWLKRFGVSTALALLVVVVVHFAIALALGQGALVRVGVFGTILVSGLLLTGVLLWLYGRKWRRPDEIRPYTVAVLLGSITAAVALEAFSAAQLLLWRSDSVSTLPGAGGPSLWRVEQLYGWHLLNSIPLLSVPRTVGIDRPAVFGDHVSGALLLAFKLTVLLPLVGLVVSGYRFADRQLAASREALQRRREGKAFFGRGWHDEIWPVAFAVAGAAALAALAVWGGLNPGSPLAGLIDDLVPSEATVQDITIPLGWVDAWVPPVIGLAVFSYGLLFVTEQVEVYTPEPPQAGVSGLGWTLAVCFGLIWVTAAIVGATILLIRTGVADPAGSVSDDQVLGVAVSFHFWHLLDGIPGLEIPQTLNWSLPHDLDDEWSGSLLLLYKAILLVALIFVTSRIVRPHLARRLSSGHGAVAAVADFERLAQQASEQLDLVERERIGGYPTRARKQFNALLSRAGEASNGVQALFGPGRVVEQADRIVALLERRNGRLYPLGFGRPDDESTDTDRAEFTAALASYRAVAGRTLRNALMRTR